MDLRIENVSHTYGKFEVLHDITLNIPQSQIVCVIGPSGCGKSTLLPWRTVEGNISLPLEEHKLSAAEREAIIADVLARTRLTDFRKALPKQLSGGMKQRVAIA